MTDEKPPIRLATDGTKEAMAKLLVKHSDKIAWGCYYAIQIVIKKASVHSREVRERMFNEGLIGEGKEHWLGTVFHKLKEEKVLEWNGHTYTYSDRERNINERTVKCWELVENSNYHAYLERPTL